MREEHVFEKVFLENWISWAVISSVTQFHTQLMNVFRQFGAFNRKQKNGLGNFFLKIEFYICVKINILVNKITLRKS